MDESLHTPRARSQRARWIVAVVFVVGGAAGGFYAAFSGGLPKRFAVVDDGILYRSAQPGRSALRRVRGDFGVRTVLILRDESPRVAEECEQAKAEGIRPVPIPIQSRKPLTTNQIDAFFRLVDDPGSRPVLVHCAAGRHRTGLLCALYRVRRQGWSPADARREMLSFGFDTTDHHALLQQFDTLCPSAGPATRSAGLK